MKINTAIGEQEVLDVEKRDALKVGDKVYHQSVEGKGY